MGEDQPEENADESLEEQPVLQGPMTRSHTKVLMKANLVMSDHFDIDNSFCPHGNAQMEEVLVILSHCSLFHGMQLINVCKSCNLRKYIHNFNVHSV